MGNLIVGSPFPNHKELLKIAEEFGDVVGGQENWLRIYRAATPERYDFLHMDLQSNPVKCYRCFHKLISVGENLGSAVLVLVLRPAALVTSAAIATLARTC